MRRSNGRIGLRVWRWAAAVLLPAALGCAPAGVSRAPAEPRDGRRQDEPHSADPAHEAQQMRRYDLDAEPAPDPSAAPAHVEEDIEPLANDAFHVEEAAPPPPQAVYGLGYRVQVFASQELGAARELQKKVAAGTGFAAYIEFEDGLYKVRAGDFATREEAAAARAVLSGEYPGCWIVQTTIETGR